MSFYEDCTYVLLERKKSIPAEFQKSVVSLAEGLDGKEIPVQLPEEKDEDSPLSIPGCPVAGSPVATGPAVGSQMAGMPPASFYTDMSRLVESLIKNHDISANQGYWRLQIFSGRP